MATRKLKSKVSDDNDNYNIDYEGVLSRFMPGGVFSNFDNLYVMNNPGGGSCLFYSVVQGIHSQFIQGYDDSLEFVIDQEEFIKDLRMEMAEELNKAIDPLDENSKTWYNVLSRGTLEEKSKDMKEFQLKSLQNVLRSGATPDLESQIFTTSSFRIVVVTSSPSK